jgi:hypothetical protein
MVLAPDELVDHIIECLAFNGDGGMLVPVSNSSLVGFTNCLDSLLDTNDVQVISSFLIKQSEVI